MRQQLPSLDKFIVLENMVDYNEIQRAANERKIAVKPDRTIILTVGRLNSSSKGMDIAIRAAKELAAKTQNFHWYFLGSGPFKEEMEEFIRIHNLVDYVTLLGTDKNPYPHFKAADIYVQTSRHE